MSRTRAELLGHDWLGYSRQVQSIDDVYNVAGLHYQVSAGQKKPKTDHFKEPPRREQKPVTNIANFNVSGLAQQVG